MFDVDFNEKARHVFGTVAQRMPNPLVYPFASNLLESPQMTLLQFRASRLDGSFHMIKAQKDLCKELVSEAKTDVQAAAHLYPAVGRLLELCIEKISRSNVFTVQYLSNPDFEEFLPQIVQMLRDSSQTVANQLRFANEVIAGSRDVKLSKESIEYISTLKQLVEKIENSEVPGYEYIAAYERSKTSNDQDRPSE